MLFGIWITRTLDFQSSGNPKIVPLLHCLYCSGNPALALACKNYFLKMPKYYNKRLAMDHIQRAFSGGGAARGGGSARASQEGLRLQRRHPQLQSQAKCQPGFGVASKMPAKWLHLGN